MSLNLKAEENLEKRHKIKLPHAVNAGRYLPKAADKALRAPTPKRGVVAASLAAAAHLLFVVI